MRSPWNLPQLHCKRLRLLSVSSLLCCYCLYTTLHFIISCFYEIIALVHQMTLSGKRSVYWIVKELVVISQVNRVRTRDLDCCLTVPLIMEAGDSLELVISRNPLAAADAELPNDCDDPSNSLFCFPNHGNNIVALWPQREILTLQYRGPLLNTHTSRG